MTCVSKGLKNPMNTAKRPLRVNVFLAVLIFGLIAFILYFYFFINPAEVIHTLSKTNLDYYACAFAVYFLFACFSSFVWRSLLDSLAVKISRRKALLLTWVGLFFDATVPQLGWSGEISKTYFLTKDLNGDSGKIGASVVGQKIFTISISVVALSVGLGLVLTSYSLPLIVIFLITTVLALSILSLLLIYYVSIKPKATKTLLNWGVRIISFFRRRWDPQNFSLKVEKMLGTFHLGMKQLRVHPKTLVKPVVFAVASFVCEISVMSLTFVALGFPVPVDKVLIVFTLTGTLQTVGVTFLGFPS